ncbi:MAG: glycoside hydrolase family 38 C-terminal domain-containing protein [Eubacteriales bacterium]
MYEDKICGEISVIDFSKIEKAGASGNPELYRNNDWMVLGPFVMKTEGAFETEYLYRRDLILAPDYLENDGGESGIAPYIGLKCRNSYLGEKEPVWKQGMNKWGALRFDPDDGDSSCDEALFMTEQRNCVFYAAVYVRCSGRKRAVVCYENSGCRLFLNGRLVSDTPYGRVKGVPTMGNLVPVTFEDGLNLLLFKLRPGYICDTVDLSMSNCSIWPVAATSGPLCLTYPATTRVFTRRDGAPKQIFPCFAAAYTDVDGGSVEIDGWQKLELGAMKAGECRLVRAELDASAAGEVSAPVGIAASGCEKSEGVFTVKSFGAPKFDGTGIATTSFHFDTTYHQEQRVYAMGAIYILREILGEMRRDDRFKAIISEIDYLHPYYSIYPHDRDFLKEKFVDGHAESDCFYNQPNEMTSSPEGLVRNLVYGQLYHRDVLGRICDVYSPGDVFGHFNQMSQLSAKGGCGGISWSKHIFGFSPAFRHVSPDGTSLIHRRGCVGIGEAERLGLSVCEEGGSCLPTVPGYPVDGDLSWLDETVPMGKYAIPSELHGAFGRDEERIVASGAPSPFALTSRDMSLYHAGTALTRSEIKQANRLAENLLISAEKFASAAALLGAKYPEKALDKAWRQLLCGQHHDSITGTNNEVSFVDLMIEYREAVELAADILSRAAGYIASGVVSAEDEVPVVVFNPHTWDRTEAVSICLSLDKKPESYVLTDPNEETVRFRIVSCEEKDGRYEAVIEFTPKAAAFGYSVYTLRTEEKLGLPGGLELPGSSVSAPAQTGRDTVIENEFFRIKVDPALGGGIVSLYDKEECRELIDAGGDGPANRVIALKETHDRMETQHEFYTTGHRLESERYSASVESEKCADYQKLTVRYGLGNVSPITQEITLRSGSRRIDFVTRCDDYRDEDDLFCVTFPTTLRGARPVFDDRFAPQVRNESLRSLDFRTHQYAMFSHCAVYAANQWMDYGPSVTVRFGAGKKKSSVNLGMTQIIRADGKGYDGTVDSLLLALTKKAVPCTVFPDVKQPCCGSQIVHFNEDLYSDTRIVLAVEGDGNEYAAKLMGGLDASVKAEFEKKLSDRGCAVLFARDSDNIWSKPIDVFLVLAASEEKLSKFVSKIEKMCAAGRFIDLPCIAAEVPGVADDYGVALLNTGNIACSVEKGGMLNMMLFHTAEFYGNIGKTNCGSKLVPERKSHVFKYSLLPHKESYREAELYRRALELNDPLFAVVPAEKRALGLPAEMSFLRTEGSGIVTAVKAGGMPMASMKGNIGGIEERGITVRCFEPDGMASETKITAGFGVLGAERTNLLEEGGEPVAIENGEIRLSLTPHTIETLHLTPEALAEPNGTVIGAEREITEPTYIRTWEHDLGSMAMGYLSVAAVISRNPTEPDGLHICTEVSVANNYTDIEASGTLRLELPEGWSASAESFEYSLAPGAHVLFPVTFTKPSEDAKGVVRLVYERDGQVFSDVFEVGYFDPEFKLSLSDGVLKATVWNHTSQKLSGELLMSSPIETWGGMDGMNPFGKAKIAPLCTPVEIEAGGMKEYVYEVSGDPNLSWYAVGKLCVNGRIQFSGVEKKGPRHCVWAHLLIDDIYADGGSLKKLLEL